MCKKCFRRNASVSWSHVTAWPDAFHLEPTSTREKDDPPCCKTGKTTVPQPSQTSFSTHHAITPQKDLTPPAEPHNSSSLSKTKHPINRPRSTPQDHAQTTHLRSASRPSFLPRHELGRAHRGRPRCRRRRVDHRPGSSVEREEYFRSTYLGSHPLPGRAPLPKLLLRR